MGVVGKELSVGHYFNFDRVRNMSQHDTVIVIGGVALLPLLFLSS